MLPEQRKFFITCVVLALGIMAFICFQGCPARITTVPDYILDKVPHELSDDQKAKFKLADEIDKINNGTFDFLDSTVFFSSLVPPQNRKMAENCLGPAALAFYQQLLKWQHGRKARVLYPIDEMRGKPTEILLLMFPILIQNQSVSLEFKNFLEKELLSAPQKKWGDFEKTLLALLYISKRFTLSELGVLMSCVSNTTQLAHLAAFVQKMPSQTSHMLSLAKLVNAGTMDDFLNYMAKWNRNGIKDMSAAMFKGAGAFNYILKHQTSIRKQGWPSYLPGNIAPFSLFDKLYVKKPALAVALKYAGIFASLLLIFISALELCDKNSLHLFVLYTLLSGVITLIIMFSGETGTLEKPQLPVLRFSHSVSDTFFINEPSAKGEKDMKFDVLPLALTLFFLVIQSFLFFLGKTQIEKIQNQNIAGSLKLKLLENEEHLFDMGLYVGLCGTILSLIFLAMGWSGIGLVSAYTSTLFGIVEVALLKLLFVRPFKRELIMQTTQNDNQTPAQDTEENSK